MLNLAMSEEAELAATSARDDRLQRLDGSGGSLNTSLEGVQLASPRGGRMAEEPREAVQLATGTLLRQRAATEAAALPLGAVVAPCLQPLEGGVRAPLPTIRRAAARCAGCGGYLNHHCESVQLTAGGVEWTCVLCGKKNVSKQVEHTLSPELQSDTVEYRSPHEQPLDLASAPPPHVVAILVDLSCGEEELRAATTALDAVLGGLNEAWRLCLLSFANIALVHELGRPGVASAQAIPGATAPSDAALARISGRRRGSFCVAADGAGVAAARMALKSLRPSPEREAGPRCVGSAITAAMAAMGAMGGEGMTGHIVLLSCGAPNLGPGAVPSAAFGAEAPEAQAESAAMHFESVGRQLAAKRVVLDLVAVGNEELGLSELIVLPQLTGGTAMLHLTAVAQPAPGEEEDEGETEGAKLLAALKANLGRLLADDARRCYDASLDVRLTPGLRYALASQSSQTNNHSTNHRASFGRVERMIGVAESPLGSSEGSAAAPVTDNYCRLTTLHPTRTVSLFLEQEADFGTQDRYAYMQLVVHHTEARDGGAAHEVVGRVTTLRSARTTSTNPTSNPQTLTQNLVFCAGWS